MEGIPEDLERFLGGNIDSIDQLEILRVLGDPPGREWGAAELAREVQAQEQVLVGHLAALHSRGLVSTSTRGADLLWRDGARTPELGGLVARLLRLYQERPVTLIRMVYAGAWSRPRRGGAASSDRA